MEPTTKILVVDDEKGICQNVEKILKKNNYEVTQAVSAQDALEKMARESFALLISDIVMPAKNGLELLKLVKKVRKKTRIPICFMLSLDNPASALYFPMQNSRKSLSNISSRGITPNSSSRAVSAGRRWVAATSRR